MFYRIGGFGSAVTIIDFSWITRIRKSLFNTYLALPVITRAYSPHIKSKNGLFRYNYLSIYKMYSVRYAGNTVTKIKNFQLSVKFIEKKKCTGLENESSGRPIFLYVFKRFSWIFLEWSCLWSLLLYPWPVVFFFKFSSAITSILQCTIVVDDLRRLCTIRVHEKVPGKLIFFVRSADV